jgi:hypothetical protein
MKACFIFMRFITMIKENRHNRKPTWSEKNPQGRWRAFDYEELINRDKASLDIFWLRDESGLLGTCPECSVKKHLFSRMKVLRY